VYLVPYSSAPINHPRDCLLVHATARLPDSIYNGGIRLKAVESLDSILVSLSLVSLATSVFVRSLAYTVVAFF
jgi:hypothetical protein